MRRHPAMVLVPAAAFGGMLLLAILVTTGARSDPRTAVYDRARQFHRALAAGREAEAATLAHPTAGPALEARRKAVRAHVGWHPVVTSVKVGVQGVAEVEAGWVEAATGREIDFREAWVQGGDGEWYFLETREAESRRR